MNPQPAFATPDVLPGLAVAFWLGLACVGLRSAARFRRGRMLSRVGYWLLLAYSAELILVAVIVGGQGVWAGLGAVGAVGAVAFGLCGPRLRKTVEEAEVRRIAARDCF